MDLNPIVFVRAEHVGNGEKWIPDGNQVTVETFKRSRTVSYMLPVTHDRLGLKRVFRKHGCSLVHAHNLPCAYYA